jgi:hypothetical protein
VKLIVKPAINDPTGGDRWDLVLSSAIELEELTFGVTLPAGTLFGDVEVIGCEPNATYPPDPQKHCAGQPPALPADCDPQETSVTCQANRLQSWTVGPHPSLPRSGTQDVMYFHLRGRLPSSLGGDTVNRLSEAVTLGTVEVPGSAGVSPSIFIEGAEELIDGPPFVESELGGIPTDEVTTIVAGGLVLADADGDGILDDDDHCVFTPSPGNPDTGYILNLPADGVGDHCQCGEANGPGMPGGGVIEGGDVALLQQVLTGQSQDAEAMARCSVSGDISCDILDVVLVELATNPATTPGPGISQLCPRAFPQGASPQ